jgi:uncharacterized protein YodC (DUF2158 family)
MTITRIGTSAGEPMVWCVWFEGAKDVYGLFPPDALKTSPEAREAPPEPAKKLEPAEVKAPAEPQPINVDSSPVVPEPAEASQDTLTTPADGAPVSKRNEMEDQIRSIQSVITNLLKRS